MTWMNDSEKSPASNSQTDICSVPDLEHLRHHYDNADGFCREVQSFIQEAGVPAINELRYAGYHLLHALTNDSEPAEDQITKAVNHCKRASYEAAEAGIITCLIKISIFKDDYKRVVISDVVDDWHEILRDCEKCKSELATSREKGDDRSGDFDIHMDAFRLLRDHCAILDASRDDMNKKIRKEQSNQRRFVFNVSVAIIGIIVAIIALF